MTLQQLENDALETCGYDNTQAAGATVRTRIRRFLNEGHRKLLTLPACAPLRRTTLTFASVASTATYALPPVVARVVKMTERDNDRTIWPRTLDWYRTLNPDPTTDGTPAYWVPMSWVQVATQPANASEVFVKSTSATDGSSTTAYVEGIRTSGYPRTLSVAMNGTTAVSLAAAITDFIEITKFYVNVAAVGTITLHEDSGTGTELARIPIGATYARYLQIALMPRPATAITYYVDADRHITDMDDPFDEPLLPPDYHAMLSVYARMREYELKHQVDLYREMAAQWADWERKLKGFLYPSDLLFVPGRQGVVGSRLGAWFPPGT